MGIEFRLLGPLEVLRDGLPVPEFAAMQRSLLACLLLEANRAVTVDVLGARLWGDSPPRDVRTTLRGYVMRLRRALGSPERIETRDGAYALTAAADEVDLLRFHALVASAQTAASADAATRLWHEALATWRGDPFSNVPCDALHRDVAPILREQRLAALECRIDGDLALGGHSNLIAELRALVRDHPLRERLWAQLMLAQHQSGRRADALESYSAITALLRSELGIDPSPELRALHLRVLNGEAVPAVVAERPRAVAPAQLPADVYGFVGRAEHLASLDGLVAARGGVAIGAVTGTAGVGKTTLAVHWAHRVRDQFPDGQLYLDLRGYGPDAPLEPGEALAWLIRSLGSAVPANPAERAAHFRSLIDRRRVLVLLDNAVNSEQVRPLLPGTPTSLVLITSRDDLAGLVARDGAHRVRVDLLPDVEALDLLRTLIGERVNEQPEAARALAARCSRLPLALRVAAESAATRPGVALVEVAEALGDEHRRRRLLSAGDDPSATVYTVFSWSYRRLAPDAVRAFRLLGVLPGQTFDEHVVAALVDGDLNAADDITTTLSRAHLIEPTHLGRYRMHDLLRGYSAELAREPEHATETRDCLTRLLDYYVFTAGAALDQVAPFERQYRTEVTVPATPVPAFPDREAGMRWLDAERRDVLAACATAAGLGFHRHVCALAQVLFRDLDTSGFMDEAHHVVRLALQSARALGDLRAEGEALVPLGAASARSGEPGAGVGMLHRAIEIAVRIADPKLQSRAQNNLNVVLRWSGEYHAALERGLAALDLSERVGDIHGQCRAHQNLSGTYLRLGDPVKGRWHIEQNLALAESVGNDVMVARALNNLGDVALEQGSFAEALRCFQQGWEICVRSQDRILEGYLLINLGIAHAHLGNLTEAASFRRRALEAATHLGDQYLVVEAHNALGEIAALSKQARVAAEHYGSALEAAERSSNRFGQSTARTGLCRIHLDLGQVEDAERQWRKARELLDQLGLPHDADLAARFP